MRVKPVQAEIVQAQKGWLAVSPKSEPIKIGRIAATREAAEADYVVALMRWREILDEARGQA